MRKPSVSAVIPVWNTDPQELREALASLRRSQVAHEVILVDDWSDSPQTLRELRQQAARGCRVIASRGRHNPSHARATGVAVASGGFCLLMDSDDTIERGRAFNPDKLAPISLATNDTDAAVPLDIWDFVEDPQPILWGCLLRSDIARRTISGIDQPRQSDIFSAARLLLSAWKHRTPVNLSGLHYRWRRPHGRDCMTSREPQDDRARQRAIERMLEQAMALDLLTREDREAVVLWRTRKSRDLPYIKSWTKPGARVDIHVVSYSGSARWLKQTLAALADQPCNVHLILGGCPGSIGQARKIGFEQGTAEYVGFADDDDMLAPGVIQALVDALDQHPDAVGAYTDTRHLHADGHHDLEKKGRPWRPMHQLLYSPEITHAKIMRREPAMRTRFEMAKWPTFEEYVQCCMVCDYGRWIHLPIDGAIKRTRPGHLSSTRLATADIWRRAVELATPIMMRALEREHVRRI